MKIEFGGNGKKEEWLLEQILEVQILTYELIHRLVVKQVESFKVKQTGDPMALAQPTPGSTLVFTATDEPVGSSLPSGVVPTWTSSDETNAPVTADSTGLVATVVLASGITVGESVTLTITATLPDGTTPTGSANFTVIAPPPPEVTSFSVVQTA